MGSYFGVIRSSGSNKLNIASLCGYILQSGRNSSSFLLYSDDGYASYCADQALASHAKELDLSRAHLVVGQAGTGLANESNGLQAVSNHVALINNGILIRRSNPSVSGAHSLSMDDSHISLEIEASLENGVALVEIPKLLCTRYDGVFACVILFPKLGKAMLFSNNGGLYLGESPQGKVFSSERYPLERMGCKGIKQIYEPVIIDIPSTDNTIKAIQGHGKSNLPIPNINKQSTTEEKLLEYPRPELRRCTKCLLPETMPFIHFDDDGVCNYCNNYKLRNQPKPKEELFELVERYRRTDQADCIVPFSGGRDSSYGLHLVVRELGMKPVTYTYDWGMVTDLAHRNVSRMCGALGVENIVVAADIKKKRDNISRNLAAWLKNPHLGMISILTAGDKHFFKYVQDIKEQTGISLNLWGVNPLEVTHFKAGFLGVRPYFEEDRVYSSGALKQLRYQSLRLGRMLQSPGYFNRSIWDTLSGEYYRSFSKKEDYYHIFDYWKWDERQIEDTLDGYGWERSEDTRSTWRIGDGTAGFYNYVYHTVAGFTEHDTFRSNQIREGDITREEGLKLIEEENRPRYQNIKWYLDTIGFDFSQVICEINKIPRLYQNI